LDVVLKLQYEHSVQATVHSVTQIK